MQKPMAKQSKAEQSTAQQRTAQQSNAKQSTSATPVEDAALRERVEFFDLRNPRGCPGPKMVISRWEVTLQIDTAAAGPDFSEIVILLLF